MLEAQTLSKGRIGGRMAELGLKRELQEQLGVGGVEE